MIKRFLCSGIAGSLLFMTAATSAQPWHCPTTSPSPCGQAQLGDVLVTLGGAHPTRVIGLNPSTRTYYVFNTEPIPSGGSHELSDIAVLPSNPVETVMIGNLDNSYIGIRKLNACGGVVEPMYGTFPDVWPLPWGGMQKPGTNNRGLVFNPVNAELFSPGTLMSFFFDPAQRQALFRFPTGGGNPNILPVTGFLLDATTRGAVAADEFGDLYLGQSNATHLQKVGASGILNLAPVGVDITPFGFNEIRDIVHDGNHHLFVTDAGVANGSFFGRVFRFNLITKALELWADNRGSFFGGDPLNELTGITIDASGDLWVVERYTFDDQRGGLLKISGQSGGVIDYFQMPEQMEGAPVAGALPNGVAIYGVNLPAVRERCAGTCNQNEVSECFGGCIWADAIGDGNCDDGPHITLNCYARDFDGGDCNGCPSGELPDCNGNCGPKGWVGDSICDSGGWEHNGNWINFDCPGFRFDEATCRTCNSDETLDCAGNCAPIGWLGDSVCDDGGWEYLGNWIDLDCAEYDFDQGTCQE